MQYEAGHAESEEEKLIVGSSMKIWQSFLLLNKSGKMYLLHQLLLWDFMKNYIEKENRETLEKIGVN